jgi:undecaprenyl-diphosphatase
VTACRRWTRPCCTPSTDSSSATTPWRIRCAGLGLLAAKLISELVDRARPFVAEPHQVHLFAAHAADPGFPSDHAAAFAIAVAIMLRKRTWGWVALGFATVLAIGRVGLGVHYPSDVSAGAALGAAAALLLWMPPLRQRVDRLADRAGGYWDRAVDRGTALLPGRSS